MKIRNTSRAFIAANSRKRRNKMHHPKNTRVEPKSRATAAAKTETKEGVIEPVREVGLGAGASAAMAEAIRAKTETKTSIKKFMEEAIF